MFLHLHDFYFFLAFEESRWIFVNKGVFLWRGLTITMKKNHDFQYVRTVPSSVGFQSWRRSLGVTKNYVVTGLASEYMGVFCRTAGCSRVSMRVGDNKKGGGWHLLACIHFKNCGGSVGVRKSKEQIFYRLILEILVKCKMNKTPLS